MGFFDIFSSEGRHRRKIEGVEKKLTNMYYQTQDRMAAAETAAELARDGHPEGYQLLLTRYENTAPSSTIDRDEKQHVHQLLLGLGDDAVEPVTEYIKRTTSTVYWPLKFINEHLGEDAFAEFLADVLESTKTDYVRDPQKKIGLVQLAGDYGTDRIYAATVPFVSDHDETVRFHAIDAVARSGRDGAPQVLVEHLVSEEDESNRCVMRIADAFVENEWKVTSHRDEFAAALPGRFKLEPNGTVTKK